MNCKKSKTYDHHRLLLNLTNKIHLSRKDIYILSMQGKILKNHIRRIDLKYQLQHGMKNLNYLMDHILYQVIILNIYLKSMEKKQFILK